jgi:hypothetical protein
MAGCPNVRLMKRGSRRMEEPPKSGGWVVKTDANCSRGHEAEHTRPCHPHGTCLARQVSILTLNLTSIGG